MEIKRNESTELRPEGARVIDAPVVQINVPEFLELIKDESTWKNSDRNAITVFKTDGMRIVLIALHKDAVIEEHATNAIISLQVMNGKIGFDAEGKNFILKKGEIITLHRNLPHKVLAIRKSVILLTVAAFKD